MKKLLLGLLLLVLVLIGVAVALPFLLPREMIKAEVERRLSAELMREVRIEGPLAFRPWRPFALTLADIHVANPDWASDPTLARIARLDLEVDALAYLGGTIALERLLIERPTLALEIREDGTPSWRFEPAADEDGDEHGGGSGGGDERQGGLPAIRIGEVRLTEGTVSFDDHATGEFRRFDAVELWARGEPDGEAPGEAGGEAGGEAIKIDGSVTSGGERATLDAAIGDLNGLLAGEPSSLTLDVAAPGLGIAANGEAAPSGSAVLALTAEASPRVLLDWLGQPVAWPDGRFETSTFTVDVAASPSGVALRAFTLEIDDLVVQGHLELDLADRPSLTGRIDLGDLDLRPYLPAAEPGTAADASPDEDPDASASWPEEPLDLPLPLPVDLDVDVGFASLLAQGFEFGEGAAALTADAESVGAEITGLDLYDGRMTSAVTLTNGLPVDVPLGLQARAEFSDVQLQPLLEATSDIEWLAGSGNVQFSVTSTGDSVAALIRDLDGEGQVLARDGAIIGFNIGATMRQVMTLGAASTAAEPQRTDFAEAGGSFTIEDGVLDNQDFSLNAPVLRVNGEGTVDLREQTLAYRLLPRLASTLEGQDASGHATYQAGIPLVIEGPWADPAINLELGGMLSGDISDPAALVETVRDIAGDPAMLENLGESLGIDPGSSLGRALEGLGGILGGGRQSPAEGEQSQPADDPVGRLFDGLGDLLRR